MASPQLQEFCIVDASTGVEVIGATIGPSGIHFRTIKMRQEPTCPCLPSPKKVAAGMASYLFSPLATASNISIQCGSAYVPQSYQTS